MPFPARLPRLTVLILAIGITTSLFAADVDGLILTWRRDPSTTMVIDWHRNGPDAPASETLSHRPAGDPTAPWREVASEPARDFPYLDRKIYRVELAGLAPDSRHEFRVGDGPVRVFATLPNRLERPLRFIVGGDMMHHEKHYSQMNRTAAALDPAFIVWGGDLAYENGRPDEAGRMARFVDIMRDTFVAPDGRVIPVLAGVGNHEVRGYFYYGKDRGRENWPATDAAREKIAPYFYALWAFPGHPGYAALDIGDYASILMLDTDHTGPIEGVQTEWLVNALKQRADVPHVIPVYHVPAYPSVRDFEGEVSQSVRTHWTPLFDRFGIRVAFENHDHAYKRTHTLRDGRPHPEGVLYIGDGAWGVGPRNPDPTRPYLVKTAKVNHAVLVEMHPDRLDMRAVRSNGEVIDEFSAPARTAPARR
jgi:Phosphodiesterase/alkaline phosphatase D